MNSPPTARDLEQMVKQFVNDLAKETSEVKESSFFKDYLDAIALFWQYSYHNQVLIFVQKKDAGLVAGFKTWNKLGRTIIPGSKSIKILAPFTKKIVEKNDLLEEKQEIITCFKPVSVFDVSQTHGKEITKLDINIEGNDYEETLKKLLKFCETKKIIVEFKTLNPNFYGYSANKKIVLNNNQSTNMQVNTLIHEIAHELIHYNPENSFSKQEKETQAESIAYIVCKAIGLKTKSPTYLALNQTTTKQLEENLKTITKTSKQILEKINPIIYLQKQEVIEFNQA